MPTIPLHWVVVLSIGVGVGVVAASDDEADVSSLDNAPLAAAKAMLLPLRHHRPCNNVGEGCDCECRSLEREEPARGVFVESCFYYVVYAVVVSCGFVASMILYTTVRSYWC